MNKKKELEVDYVDFYKNNPKDKVYWTEPIGIIGEFLFSFDKKKIYNLFRDYPQALTKEELEIFNKENPYWVEFFRDRLEALEK